jgi:phosphoribosylaminoimidazolecarboxamide formyltransferase/IMP cyclohydrolase
MSMQKISLALVSVSEKKGLIEFAGGLSRLGVELISTGGTSKALREAGLPVRDVAEITGFPEMLDGRVKTLHPRVHGGILAMRGNPVHQAALAEHGIAPIDMVVCNLYPFEQTVARTGSSHEDIVENIDIGGPSMVRSAAKNYHDVAVVTDPDQYQSVLAEMQANQGALGRATREALAAAAFARTAAYDAAIAGYFAGRREGQEPWPARLTLTFQRKQELRYGENPHQKAAFFVEAGWPHPCVATAEVLHGKELSYNNILDLDSAFNLVREFSGPAAVVIKHNNPCGAATAERMADAFRKAYEGDPVSAYGGVLGFNRDIDEATAALITEPNRFIECIIAPGYSDAAFHLLTTRPTWKKNVRLLRTGPWSSGEPAARDYRRVGGGLLVQTRDIPADDFAHARVVSRRQPTDRELADLRFAWLVAKHVKSNAITLVREHMLVGVGAGQMSRVDSVHIAGCKAGERVRGSVLASDAFFPFRDNVDEAARMGVTAIVQPGGSMRDQDSIAACDEHGLAMVFTGTRHFRH